MGASIPAIAFIGGQRRSAKQVSRRYLGTSALHKAFVFGVSFLLTLCLSIQVNAQSDRHHPDNPPPLDLNWEVLEPAEKRIIDRIARDFYENTLHDVQSNAIEDHTAEQFRSGDRLSRARFVAARKAAWRALPKSAQDALRNAKSPKFDNLTPIQKSPFRRHAIETLVNADAINATALVLALRSEV